MHSVLHSKLLRVEEAAARRGLFKLSILILAPGRLGIITASAPANYVFDYLNRRKLRGKIGILKLGLTLPFPKGVASEFVKGYDEVLVVEEGEPYIERGIASLAKDLKPSLRVHGKEDRSLPREGELNYGLVDLAISNLLGIPAEEVPLIKSEVMADAARLLTPRTLTMCAGCPHRAAFYAAKKATRSVANARYIAIGDIGCYTLGMYPPLKFMQDVFCMGGSVGFANGVAKSGIPDPVIATTGDSTFFHAAYPP
jgi:indolepyruvate ferredoxin oxidoreductase alpha subunit